MKGSNVTCRALIGGEMLVTLGICRRYPQSHSILLLFSFFLYYPINSLQRVKKGNSTSKFKTSYTFNENALFFHSMSVSNQIINGKFASALFHWFFKKESKLIFKFSTYDPPCLLANPMNYN